MSQSHWRLPCPPAASLRIPNSWKTREEEQEIPQGRREKLQVDPRKPENRDASCVARNVIPNGPKLGSFPFSHLLYPHRNDPAPLQDDGEIPGPSRLDEEGKFGKEEDPKGWSFLPKLPSFISLRSPRHSRPHSAKEEEEEEEEEEVEKKHRSSDQVENEEEEGYAERGEYRSRLPAENEKRSAASYSSFYPLLWWKSRQFEKRGSTGEQLLQGREESRSALKEKSLFPEYNDYDWWEDKQILSALKHKRTERRNPSKMNRNDVERQYNKMDELAQLLNYRKKSAEFPELYSSGEDLKKRHITGSDRSLSQRPLTEEEEKELENLAAMDLELQSIAEKLNSLRRG